MLDPTNVYGVYLLFISSQRKTSKCLKKIQKNFQLTEKTKSKIAKMKFIFLLIYYIRGTVNGQGSSYRKLFESLIVSPSKIFQPLHIFSQNSTGQVILLTDIISLMYRWV